MKIKQLSIFIENQPGRLYKALEILAQEDVNIRALSLADTSEFAILRLVVNSPEKGMEILEKNNFIVKLTDIIGVELDDTPGGLTKVLKILNDENIDLEYLYAFTHDQTSKAILLMHANDLDEMINVLDSNNAKIVPADVVYNL
jgi:hypothetical protein